MVRSHSRRRRCLYIATRLMRERCGDQPTPLRVRAVCRPMFVNDCFASCCSYTTTGSRPTSTFIGMFQIAIQQLQFNLDYVVQFELRAVGLRAVSISPSPFFTTPAVAAQCNECGESWTGLAK